MDAFSNVSDHGKDLLRCVSYDAAEDRWPGDCDDYTRYAFRFSAPGLAAAAVILIVAVLYLLAIACKLLLCICRCCRASHHGGAERPAVRCYRGLFWATAVALLAAGAAATAANAHLKSELSDVQDVVRGVRTDTVAAFDGLAARVARFTAAEELHGGGVRAQADAARDKFASWARKMHDVEDGLTAYLWCVYAAAWLAAGTACLAALAAQLNVHRCAPQLAAAAFFVVGLAGVCTVQTLTGVSFSFVHDGCGVRGALEANLAQFFASPRYAGTAAVQAAAALPAQLEGLLRNGTCAQGANTSAAELCASAFSCPAGCDAAAPDAPAAFLNQTLLTDEAARGSCSGSCTILRCAEECAEGSVARGLSGAVARIFADGEAAHAQAAAVSAGYADAALFRRGISAAFDETCSANDVSDAAGVLLIPLSLAAGFVAVAMALAAMGSFCYVARDTEESVALVSYGQGYNDGEIQKGGPRVYDA